MHMYMHTWDAYMRGHAYMSEFAHVYTRPWMCACIPVCMHAYIHASLHARAPMRTCVNACMHSGIMHMCMHANMHVVGIGAFMQTRIHATCIYAIVLAYVHLFTSMHAHIRVPADAGMPAYMHDQVDVPSGVII